MSRETENIDLLRKRRSIFRRITTRILNKVEAIKDDEEEVDVREAKKIEIQLKEKQAQLKEVDARILDYLLANESEETCERELEEANEYGERITKSLILIEEDLEQVEERASVSSAGSRISRSSAGSIKSPNEYSKKKSARVKLPQLEIKKYSGKAHEFQEFWDSYSSAIHENDELADVDKLKYLKGLLEEPARSVIGGLPMTEANYVIAVDLLRKRFAKPAMIQHAHINQLINLAPVFNEDDVRRLRSFRDQIEAHFRGLQAMCVDQMTYSRIVVPVLVEKLPKTLRFSMVRAVGKTALEWSVEEFLNAIDLELEVRECFNSPLKSDHFAVATNGTRRPKMSGGGSASALYASAGQEKKKKCVYCEEEHRPEECQKHKDPDERKGSILFFYGLPL